MLIQSELQELIKKELPKLKDQLGEVHSSDIKSNWSKRRILDKILVLFLKATMVDRYPGKHYYDKLVVSDTIDFFKNIKPVKEQDKLQWGLALERLYETAELIKGVVNKTVPEDAISWSKLELKLRGIYFS